MINFVEIFDEYGVTESTAKASCDCGCEFFTDGDTDLNVVWDAGRKASVPCCPECSEVSS